MKLTLAIFLLLISSSCFSDAFRIGFGVGFGDVDAKGDFDGDENDAGNDSMSALFYVGYIFDDTIVIDLAHGGVTDDVFGGTDNVHLDTYEALLGYRFNFEKFYLEPKLGYAKWDFKLEEGAFLNPGPEEGIQGSGSDPLVSLLAGVRFTPVFDMSISYKYLDFEYGHADSVYVGFNFEF